MNDEVLFFVDTNVLVYSRDPTDTVKHSLAFDWLAFLWKTLAGRISFQVLQEFYVTAAQKLKPGLPREVARDDVRILMVWEPLSPDEKFFENAWRVQDRYGFSWWDSLIVSAALASECHFLLTEDLQTGQKIETLTVVNPFESSPAEFQ